MRSLYAIPVQIRYSTKLHPRFYLHLAPRASLSLLNKIVEKRLVWVTKVIDLERMHLTNVIIFKMNLVCNRPSPTLYTNLSTNPLLPSLPTSLTPLPPSPTLWHHPLLPIHNISDLQWRSPCFQYAHHISTTVTGSAWKVASLNGKEEEHPTALSTDCPKAAIFSNKSTQA